MVMFEVKTPGLGILPVMFLLKGCQAHWDLIKMLGLHRPLSDVPALAGVV